MKEDKKDARTLVSVKIVYEEVLFPTEPSPPRISIGETTHADLTRREALRLIRGSDPIEVNENQWVPRTRVLQYEIEHQ